MSETDEIISVQIELDSLSQNVNDLRKSCENNIEYFRNDSCASAVNLLVYFKRINEALNKSVPIVKEVSVFAFEYDFDENTPGNGYHSFVAMYEEAVKYCLKNAKYIETHKGRLFFSKKSAEKKIAICCPLLEQLGIIFEKLLVIRSETLNGNLFTSEKTADDTFALSILDIEQECFYGKPLGFYFNDSVRQIMKGLQLLLTGYSKVYYTKNCFAKAAKSVYYGPKYCFNQKARSKRYMDIMMNSDVYFIKNAFKLGESKFNNFFLSFTYTSLKVNKSITIPCEDLEMFSEKLQKTVQIPVPSCYTGKRPVKGRLLSSTKRIGMDWKSKSQPTRSSTPPSNKLLFYLHGGGFCANTTLTFQVYLCQWAKKLDVPILSIDYSLAPEIPYPGSIEDIYYAYCWALKHPDKFGTTAEKIVFAGDSAGATLCVNLITKCIENGVRVPDGLLFIYGGATLHLNFNPALLITLTYPLIDLRFLIRFQKGYAGIPKPDNSERVKDENDAKLLNGASSKQIIQSKKSDIPSAPEDEFHFSMPKDCYIQPITIPDDILKQFPPVDLVSSEYDFLLDHTVEFAKQLRNVNVPVELKLYNGIPHAFLNFIQLNKKCRAATNGCLDSIKKLLEIP